MRMHNPPHPGTVLKNTCLEPLKLTVTDAANGLGVSRNQLSMVLNGRAGVSPEMAVRLSKAFGGDPENWLALQMRHDLWHAQQRANKNANKIRVKRFKRAAVATAE